MNRRELLQLISVGALSTLGGCSRKVDALNEWQLMELDAIAQADLVVSGKLSARELVQAAITRLNKFNPAINAVIATDFDRALAKANSAKGPLAGVPFLLKDLNEYSGLPFTRGSRLFAEAIAEKQSPYTDKIDASGLITLGKTNTPEFGLLPSTEPLLHGATRNPWNVDHTPGGSSGGTAAAVAARIVPAAQGGDGGGSIRIPAAQCGLFGLKPSVGRFPDQHNPGRGWPIAIKHALTLSVRDSALILALTENTLDGDLMPVGFVERTASRPLRIALTLRGATGKLPTADVIRAVEGAAARLEQFGHKIELVEETPLQDDAASNDFLTLWASGAHAVSELVRQKTGQDPALTGLLEPPTIALAQMYATLPKGALDNAIAGLAAHQRKTLEFMGQYDAWLTPVTSSAAPKIGYFSPEVPYEELMPRVLDFAAYTAIHNVAGTPAMSVPAGFSDDKLPIGVQIATGIGGEALLLQLAYELEEAQPWMSELPPLVAGAG